MFIVLVGLFLFIWCVSYKGKPRYFFRSLVYTILIFILGILVSVVGLMH